MTALTSCVFFPITNLPFSLYPAKRLGHYWFKRYFEEQIHMDYGKYQREGVRAFEAQGRCLNLTVAYNFGFGRKHQAGSQEVDKKIDSAILKP